MSPVLLCSGTRRPGSAPQPRACEQERSSLRPCNTRGSKRSLPARSRCFDKRNLSLGGGTVLGITSSLPGSVLSPGQELLVSWGSLGCKRHPVPALGLFSVPSGLGDDPGASSPAPAELCDFPLPTLLDPKQTFLRKKVKLLQGNNPPFSISMQHASSFTNKKAFFSFPLFPDFFLPSTLRN